MADRTAQEAADLRRALLDQLAYLVDEVEALEAIIGRVPDALLEGRPLEEDWSIKETYGAMAAADEHVFLPALRRMAAEEEPRLEEVAERALVEREPWNAYPVGEILARVRQGRAALLDFLRALPPEAWSRAGWWGAERRDVYAVAYGLTQRDVEHLRAMSQRLHDSHLTQRPHDLPK